MSDKPIDLRSSSKEIEQFLEQVKNVPAPVVGQKVVGQETAGSEVEVGRLIFAMDATASRERLWDIASHYHSEMFSAAAKSGKLSIQLCYYRGYGEFKATKWTQESQTLQRAISAVTCLAGRTQISKVLNHAITETQSNKVNALVLVGDCVEESIDRLGDLAGRLGILRVPVFVFQEGQDATATRAFSHLAKLSGGAHCHFDSHSAEQLGVLLAAVAEYATGGKAALKRLENQHRPHIKALLKQLKD